MHGRPFREETAPCCSFASRPPRPGRFPPGTSVSTADHPIQSFQWGDYTAKAGHTYRYRVIPAYGTPKLLQLDEDASVEVDISTEPEAGYVEGGANTIRHDVYFNRGVIGSQAYAREFGNRVPNRNNPASPEMGWLSRGLFEALQRFIGYAADERFDLRAAFYEFYYQAVAKAFAKAADGGADVKIVFDAVSPYKTGNLETIGRARLDELDAAIPRTVSEKLRHNKFIILIENDGDVQRPVAVWTGSTNISAGGIFSHSNVGHVVWDARVAQAYLDYWNLLAQNLTPTKLRQEP